MLDRFHGQPNRHLTCRSVSTGFMRAVVPVLVFVGAACGAAATATPLPPPATPTPAAASESGVTPILATTVLSVGSHRVAFLLAGPRGIITAPTAQVTPVFLGGDPSGSTMKPQQARFHSWPYGVRGAYSTRLDFAQPGSWRLDIEVKDDEGPLKTSIDLTVPAESEIPEVGETAPATANKTLATVATVEELTTDYTPDPDLYQQSVDQAIGTNLPTVVVFATPAFCTSPTCGPQVDEVSALKDAHQPRANFIHVELYDNPAEIQGDLSKAQLVSHADDWGFTTIPGWLNESWVFVLDSGGKIVQRFEGFTTVEEMEEALLPLLTQS